MSGRRPDTTQVWTQLTQWREAGLTPAEKASTARAIDLPQWFKQHGWWTTNTGKTWHNGAGYNPPDDWSDLSQFPTRMAWPGFYFDVNNTDVSVARIAHAAALAQPFLVVHGFVKRKCGRSMRVVFGSLKEAAASQPICRGSTRPK